MNFLRFLHLQPSVSEQKFSDAFSRAAEVAENFTAKEQSCRSPKYSRAQARLGFTDKFWLAPGWSRNTPSAVQSDFEQFPVINRRS